MVGLEIGSIEGFPEVSIAQPLFTIIRPNSDFTLSALGPEFQNETDIDRFRYALAGALMPALEDIHGFQVQHMQSKPAVRRMYGARKHDFAITQAGLFSADVENHLTGLRTQEDGEIAFSFTATDTKINPDFLKACLTAIGPLAIGGLRELYWRKGGMKGGYEGVITGLSLSGNTQKKGERSTLDKFLDI